MSSPALAGSCSPAKTIDVNTVQVQHAARRGVTCHLDTITGPSEGVALRQGSGDRDAGQKGRRGSGKGRQADSEVLSYARPRLCVIFHETRARSWRLVVQGA